MMNPKSRAVGHRRARIWGQSSLLELGSVVFPLCSHDMSSQHIMVSMLHLSSCSSLCYPLQLHFFLLFALGAASTDGGHPELEAEGAGLGSMLNISLS